MSLLITPAALETRAGAARRGLAPLAASLSADLDLVIARGVDIPRAKALLSRDGGRCPEHGVALEFDPFAPREHRCPVDGRMLGGERHDRWWVTWFQLWLAERAVHGALLFALLGHRAAAALARTILQGYAERYLEYPNHDNVLGPSRPFFSTYLESIWLLQLCLALDLLEMRGAAGAELAGAVRERIVEPSAALIASFDEGESNRQVWNNAALMAANALLGRPERARRLMDGASGLLAHLGGALLPDGTWYEGENYHLFAHRGLWYGVNLAEALGIDLPAELVRRFTEGFAAPLATALPDYTAPSRRDSPYRVSLRQWRFAESCELGLARSDDARLRGALWELYEHATVPQRDTGRWRSTAESERNEPASALGRADLGWRSLLLARESLPPLEPVPPRSLLLEGQGIAVLRRDAGRTYLALDYGHSGGGHGHPDRLNVLLARGDERWLDDVGTGSYVDPSLFWYRSTLAHNAPLVNGRSQEPADGVLRAFDERGGVGWVDAELPRGAAAPGVRLRRSLVGMPDYAVDRLEWEADEPVEVTLPLHLDVEVEGTGAWHAAAPGGGSAREDGFAFLDGAVVAEAEARTIIRLLRAGVVLGWAVCDGPCQWWRVVGPGPPSVGVPAAREFAELPFVLARARRSRGAITIVWDWGAVVRRVALPGDVLVVERTDGASHEHMVEADGWRIALASGGSRSSIQLAGARAAAAPVRTPPVDAGERLAPVVVPVAPASRCFHLGERAYRMSEVSWAGAGRPEADVCMASAAGELRVDVRVRKTPLIFRPADAPDPALDNECPDIHSDGVQLHLAPDDEPAQEAWLVVPEPDGALRVRRTAGADAASSLSGTWAAEAGGYRVSLRARAPAILAVPGQPFRLQVVVNDMATGRMRRRGQLVLGDCAGETIYLRGDREQPARFRRFVLQHG